MIVAVSTERMCENDCGRAAVWWDQFTFYCTTCLVAVASNRTGPRRRWDW